MRLCSERRDDDVAKKDASNIKQRLHGVDLRGCNSFIDLRGLAWRVLCVCGGHGDSLQWLFVAMVIIGVCGRFVRGGHGERRGGAACRGSLG